MFLEQSFLSQLVVKVTSLISSGTFDGEKIFVGCINIPVALARWDKSQSNSVIL